MADDKLPDTPKAFRRYKTTVSPINLNTQLELGKRTFQDWNRLDAGPVRINGVEVKELVRIDRGLTEAPATDKLFKNEAELNDFFNKHLLKNLPSTTIDEINQKKSALYYTFGIMHQGALLAPVTAAAAVQITQNSDFGPVSASNEDPDAQTRELNIVTTSTGFKVQEISIQRKMAYGMNSENAGEDIKPDPGHKYIYKAQGTFDVNFSKAPSERIKIESNAIDFGNKQVEKVLDIRTFLQKFIDGIVSIVGRYQIANLRHDEPKMQEKLSSLPDSLSPPTGSQIARDIMKERRDEGLKKDSPTSEPDEPSLKH